MPVKIANMENPDQTASSVLSSLIWVCIVCLGLFGRQPVFEILEHLSYANFGTEEYCMLSVQIDVI